jgi:hypothetical protein
VQAVGDLLGRGYADPGESGSGQRVPVFGPGEGPGDAAGQAAAITVGRTFSATFAGIASASVPGFIVAQIIGGGLAVVIIRILYPAITAAEAADVILPHQQTGPRPAAGTPRERRV